MTGLECATGGVIVLPLDGGPKGGQMPNGRIVGGSLLPPAKGSLFSK